MKKIVTLRRLTDNGVQTLGLMSCEGGKTIHTLELPWKDNARRISCIPKGQYNVVPRFVPKFKNHFHVLDVPGRDWILFHSAAYHTDIQGCIAPGLGLLDMNGDGNLDVVNSRGAMKFLLEQYPEGFTLNVV